MKLGLFKSEVIKMHTFLFLESAIVFTVCSTTPACRINNLMGLVISYEKHKKILQL